MSNIVVRLLNAGYPTETRGYPLEETIINFAKKEVPFATNLNRNGDYEDFYENFMRLYYVALNYKQEEITIHHNDNYYSYATKALLTKEEITSILKQETTILYGMKHEAERTEQDFLADAYCNSKAYHKYANRYAEVLGFPEDPEDEPTTFLPENENALTQIKNLRNKCIHKFVLKDTRPKHGIYFINLTSVPNTDESLIEYMKTYFTENGNDWGMYYLLSGKPTYIVQEYKQMKYEYRFFIINGKLTSGAGCIEEHTPLANTKQFNTLVEENRNNSPIEDNPNLIQRYITIAENITSLTNETEPQLKNYTIDLCLYEDDTIGMIERNSSSNSGLYAQDLNRIVQALKK